MPSFDIDETIDITPDEFVDSCDSEEIKELIDALYEGGHKLITPDEFVDSCDSEEIKELIDALYKGGHLTSDLIQPTGRPHSVNEQLFKEKIEKLYNSYLMLTAEEELIIDEIVNRIA
jgi:hypothetical protein